MNYLYSFSGADAKAYAYFDQVEDKVVRLESLHTLSFSVHEAKGMVRSLGFRSMRGMARGVRTIAGSMIFVVVQDHPLRDLIRNSFQSPNEGRNGWSIDKYLTGTGAALDQLSFENRLPTLMPPFNLLLTYVSEVARYDFDFENGDGLRVDGAALLLKGVEFLDEGLVTSVNDIVSEVTYSFVARDAKPLSMNTFGLEVKPPVVGSREARRQQEELNRILNEGNPYPGRVEPKYFDEFGNEISEQEALGMDSETYALYKLGRSS